MNNKTKTRSLRVAIIAIALLLCFALAVGVTSALYQARRQATGTLNMDKSIVIDYKGFNKGDENIWQRETTTSFKLFEETNAQPGQEISVYPSGIRANVDSINFYARLKLEYIFYNVANGVETKVDLPNPKSLIKTSNDFFASNWVPSTDGYYYFGENTTLNQFSKDNQNFENLFADGAKFIIEGANFEGETAGEGGGFVVNGTAINKIVVYLTLETLQGDATAEQAKDLGWAITTLNEQIVDITNIPDEKPEINIDDIISDDKKDGEITITGDPKQPLTITIGSKAFYGCSKLKLTLSNSENIEYRIATDAFSTGATIMYGIDNVSSKLINPSTTGHTTVGFDGKWQVSAPGLYLFLPSPITSTSSEYGDFQYTDDQGTWYFDLIDESGNKVDASTLSSTISRNGASTFGASTYANTDNYTAKLNKFEPKDGVTTVVIPKYLGISEDSNKFAVTKIDRYNYRESHGDWTSSGTRGAFYGLRNIYSISIPDSVTSIGGEAFQSCSGLTSITIPDSVTSIENWAFAWCSGLTSVIIGSSVTSIGESAFSGCSGLTSVKIGSGVTSIGDYAFYDCSGLTSITIPDSVTSIGYHAFSACSGLTSIIVDRENTRYHSAGNCLIETASKTLITGCKNSKIPADGSVTRIENSAFLGCSGLTSITIPNSVTRIEGSAFSGCSGLTSVTIGNGVTSIGESAFSGCRGLTSITIPNSATRIEGSAFYDCSGLTSITIPNGVTRIGDYAFSGCSGLTSIDIGAGIQEVSWLPDNVSKITVTISKDNQYLATEGKAIFAKADGKLSVSKYISADTTYDIPSAVDGSPVTSIGTYAFSGCSGLTSITIPDSVISIGHSAFSGCSGLISITIPNGVTSIGKDTFNSCSGLTSITIPDSVISIGHSAFSGCSGLISITIPDSVTSIESWAFNNCRGLTSITIPDSVTSSIGSSAFYYCSGLTSVTIGNGVTSIGYRAFSGCGGLTSVTIGSGVTSIEEEAFLACSGLTSIVLPEGIKEIPYSCFKGCTNLGSITIPSTCTTIGNSAFENCSNLTTVIWNISYDLGGVNATGPELSSYTGSQTSGLTMDDVIKSAPTNVESGFTFEGWSDGTNIYQPGEKITFSLKNRKLTAIWSNYKISFDSNGGEGSIDSIIVAKGSSITLPSLDSYIRNGYVALGWTLNKNSIEAGYTAGSSYKPTNNVTFYAVWVSVSNENTTGFTNVKFDLNGGEGKLTFEGVFANNRFLSLPGISGVTKAGYMFKGWAISQTSKVDYIPGESVYWNANMVIYAIWGQPIKFVLKANGGVGEDVTITETDTLKSVTTNDYFARLGYGLLGFSTNKDATTAEVGTVIKFSHYSEDQVLYAIWEKYIEISFDRNGGEGDVISSIFAKPNNYTDFTFPDLTGSREGYKFLGWSEDKDATKATYAGGEYIYDETYTRDVKYYAVWRQPIKLVFKANGGVGEDVTITETDTLKSILISNYVNSSTFTRNGYYLLGFSTNPNETTADLNLSSYINLSNYDGDQTFYAIWKAYPTITFDPNSGTGSGSYRFTSNNDSFCLTNYSNNFTAPDGYALAGWSINASAETAEYGIDSWIYAYNFDNDTTLYAVWKKLATITFDLDGGEGILPQPIRVAQGNNVFVNTGSDFTKSGYKFACWDLYDENGKSLARYYNGENFTFNYSGLSYTFKAMWDSETTVTFYNDDTKSQSFTKTGYLYADGLQMPDGQNIITKEGYILVGWATSPNSTYVPYSVGSIAKGSYTEFYAVWKTESECAKVILILTDVEGQSNIEYIGYQNYYTIPDLSSLKNAAGQKIIGWSTTQGSSSPTWSSGSQIWLGNYTGSILTLYPVWKTLYKLTFDLNGGVGDIPTMDIEAYKWVNIPETKPTKDGYMFKGWAWDANSSYADYNAGNSCHIDSESDKTLYALWAEIIIISFDANGGTGDVPSSIETYDQGRFDIPEASLTKDGYMFAGWAWRADYDGTEYRNGQKDCYFSINNSNGSTTLYAMWRSPLTIKFDLNGGEGTVPEDITTYYQGRFDIPKAALTKEGYTFLGWDYNANKSGWAYIEYQNGATDNGYYEQTSKTLYAIWGAPVNITFDLNGGEGTIPEDITGINYGDQFTIPSVTLTRLGYNFIGWARRQNANGDYDWSNGTTTSSRFISGNFTIYAQWEVLNNEVFVGSLTQAEIDEVQALWNGHNSLSELTDTSILSNLYNKDAHIRFSVAAYLNNTKITNFERTSNSSYGIYAYRYKLSTNSYTFEFENSLPTGWMLVNWRYEVKASGDVTIVNGKAQATIDYTYVDLSSADQSDNFMILFVLPNQPAESESVSVSISGLPANALEALLNGTGNDALNYLMLSGITVEIYDADGSLIWIGKPNDSNEGFVKYRFATGTYKIRFYTTNVNGVAFVDNDNGTEVTGMNISEITKGDDYSEFTINYTFAEGNPNLAIIFTMANVDLDKIMEVQAYKDFSGPSNIVGNWFKGVFANMGVAFTDMTADEIKYAGYCGMLIQEYFNGSICYLPSFSIYTADGKIIENCENMALIAGVEYTIKFTEEVKELLIAGNDTMSIKSVTDITYNAETGTWDATFNVFDTESSILMFFTADLDLSQYEDIPEYDATQDYSQYLEMH